MNMVLRVPPLLNMVLRVPPLIKRGGTCTRTISDPTEDVLERAHVHLEKGFGDYNLFQNNCEDFAKYCKTGWLKEGRRGQIQFLFDILLVVLFTPYQFLPSGLALVVYGLLYLGFRLIEGRDIIEKDTRMENVGSTSYLSTSDFVSRYYLYNMPRGLGMTPAKRRYK